MPTAKAPTAERVIHLGKARAFLALDPASYDEAKGEMAVLWHNEGFLFEQPVRKGDWDYETVFVKLSFEPGAMRTTRIDAGLPILHEHGRSGIRNNLLGRTDKWSIEGAAPNRRAIANVRFTRREDAEVKGILSDIKDGILGGISAGVSLFKLRPTGEARDGLVVHEAVDWEPFEISFTADPRDPNATSLSQSDDSAPCIVLPLDTDNRAPGAGHSANVKLSGSDGMKPKPDGEGGGENGGEAGGGAGNEPTATATLTREKHAELASAAATKAAADERARCAAIATLAREHSIEPELSERWVAEGVTLAAAQAETLALLSQRQKAAGLPASGAVKVGEGPLDRVTRGVEAAMLARVSGSVRGGQPVDAKLAELARPFRGLTMLEQARAVLSARGVAVEGKGRKEVALLALGMHGVSDFTKILENVQTKFLQDRYLSVDPTFDKLAKEREAVDFKPISTVNIGLGSAMREILPGEPIRFGTFGEHGEKFAVKRYGVGTSFGVQAIVNDDLNAFDALGAYGVEARMLPNRLNWALITGNVVMADSIALFHASHANMLTVGSADKVLSEEGLSALRKLLRVQTEPDGKKLGLTGRFLVVPAALETTAKKLVSAVSPTATSGVNTFTGLEVLVEPELDGASATAYYLVTGPTQMPAFEVAYLDGNKMPTISTETDFDTGALKLKAEIEVGVCVPNHRAWTTSAGTTA